MKKIAFFVIFLTLIATKTNAQTEERNPISLSIPFLQLVPDARAAGMGDMGVATFSDANAQFHNPAKYAFSNYQYKGSVTYTPWLRQLTNDVFLGNVMFANRLNENSSWAFSLNYFSYGKIETNAGIQGSELITTGVENPYDLSLNGSYALKLSPTFSMGVKVGYVRSDLAIRSAETQNEIQAINSVSVGVSGFYQSDEKNFGDFNGKWRAGFNLDNVGPKIQRSVGGPESYIPTNLKLGGGFEFILDGFNTITTNVEFTKLLVPTPSVLVSTNSDGTKTYRQEDVGFVAGMFQSFGDAPGGFSEELKEVTWAVGAEYFYDKTFGVRTGYFHESEMKGERRYFTLGAGFKFNSLNFDLSYLINASDVNNPLENTLRFSLAFNFGDVYEDF